VVRRRPCRHLAGEWCADLRFHRLRIQSDQQRGLHAQ
jgi:hypothetical protein